MSRFPSLAALAAVCLLIAPLTAHAGATDANATPTDAAVTPSAAAWRQQLPAESRSLMDRLGARLEAAYDEKHGYVDKNRLPSESSIEIALMNGRGESDSYWNAHARQSVDWMVTLFDTTMGGFFHGAEDSDVKSAAYAKRTDSNARRFEAVMLAWEATGDPRLKRLMRKEAEYFQRVLAEGRAGFVWGQVGDRQLYPEPNGLAIRSWLHYATLNADPRARDYALKSLDAVFEQSWMGFGAFWRQSFLQDLEKGARASDQAVMGRAYIYAARVAGREDDRTRAEAIGDLLLQRFIDAEDGHFNTTVAPKKDGSTRGSGRESLDNALVVRFLAELTHLTGEEKYRDAARGTVRAFAEDFDKMKLDAADWALAVRALSVNDLPSAPEWKSVVQNVPSTQSRSKTYRAGK
ncbi:MAG: hypothetical protein HOP12_05080 [Candidatus Eisenbacteria bacterium]|uniref:Glycosyl hydrolase n=1 Tax=Eiseniibacteriota bacterium TaxID=2212470 RepID=A0A849SWK8_UNCEI|nr:hypothetical protein [Candidatus Eisenbacteria bacterium]